MSKRKTETISGYITDTSPAKSGFVRFRVQTAENKFRKAICFDQTQVVKIKQHEISGESVLLRSIKVNDNKNNPSFAELIFDERSTIEKPVKGSIKFQREDPSCNLMNIENIIKEPQLESRVNVRGALLYNAKNIVKRGSSNMLECKLKDATGHIPVTLWGDYIEILMKNVGKSFTFHEIFVKDFKGVRLTTTTGTVMVPVEATDIEKDILATEDDDTVITETDTLEGLVEYIKHFSIYFNCKFCNKKLTDIMTLRKAKCNTCSTVQLVAGCEINRSVQISINGMQITLFDDIISTLVEDSDNEEELSDALIGKTMQVSFNKFTKIASEVCMTEQL